MSLKAVLHDALKTPHAPLRALTLQTLVLGVLLPFIEC